MKTILLLALFIFTGGILWNTSLAGPGPLGLGAGLFNPHMGEVQTDLNGSTKSVDLHPFITATASYNFTQEMALEGHLGLGIPQTSQDQSIKKSYHFANLYFVYRYLNFDFSAGPGVLLTRISGEGGTKTLRNGNTSSSFYIPSASSTASNTTLNIGAGTTFEKLLKANIMAVWTNPTVKEKRSISLNFSLTYILDIWSFRK